MLETLSPLDNRYKQNTSFTKKYFSEYSFCKYRIQIELQYFEHLCKLNLQELNNIDTSFLSTIFNNFTYDEFLKVKQYEKNKT